MKLRHVSTARTAWILTLALTIGLAAACGSSNDEVLTPPSGGLSSSTVASLIVGAHHISKAGRYSADPYPLPAHLETVQASDSGELLRVLDDAVRSNDQARACAAVSRYEEHGHCEDDVFNVLRRFAISEDGRLHGEKYYITVREEFARTRPAFRWRHLIGLARASASAYGYSVDDAPGHRAPGYEQACHLLGVEA